MRGTIPKNSLKTRTMKGENGPIPSTHISLFKKGLSASAPMLQDLGMGETLGTAVKGLQSYDTVRKQVMDVDERGRGHLDRISKAIA